MMLPSSSISQDTTMQVDKPAFSYHHRYVPQRRLSIPPRGVRRRPRSNSLPVDLKVLDRDLFFNTVRVLPGPIDSSADAQDHPRILTRPLMQALQDHIPISKRFESFWLKYSLVRDGAFLPRMLEQIRASTCTLFAIETVDGEVFGSFTGSPWRIDYEYYGSGESFLWRGRSEESSWTSGHPQVDAFHYTGANDFVQLCHYDVLAVGGGSPASILLDTTTVTETSFKIPPHEWGAGLFIFQDLLKGTTSRCATFNSPSLSRCHSDGSLFEIANLEVWTFTPCINLEQAIALENLRR